MEIDLEELVGGMPGLSPRMGAAMAEAAGVCFDDCGHCSPTTLRLLGDLGGKADVSWQVPDQQAKRSWADESYATEQGAYAVAIGIACQARGLVALERSRKFNGFDYWLGRDETTLFTNKVRLEVSGIRRGTAAQLTARVRQKVNQIEVSCGLLKGLVIVVEFGKPCAQAADR